MQTVWLSVDHHRDRPPARQVAGGRHAGAARRRCSHAPAPALAAQRLACGSRLRPAQPSSWRRSPECRANSSPAAISPGAAKRCERALQASAAGFLRRALRGSRAVGTVQHGRGRDRHLCPRRSGETCGLRADRLDGIALSASRRRCRAASRSCSRCTASRAPPTGRSASIPRSSSWMRPTAHAALRLPELRRRSVRRRC